MMKKVAIVLSGCGSNDGSETREAIFSMLSLASLNIKYECFAPDILQSKVFNHFTNEYVNEERNVLHESARLARGRVKNIELLKEEEFDGIVFPGGYGAAMNLSNFFSKQDETYTLQKNVEEVILAFKNSKKPLCFLCAASLLPIKLFENIKLTFGEEDSFSKSLQKLGVENIKMSANNPVLDAKHKIVTIPCYLANINIVELYRGILEGITIFSKL